MAKRFVVRIMLSGCMETDMAMKESVTKDGAISFAQSAWEEIPVEQRRKLDSWACVLEVELADGFTDDEYVEAVETGREIFFREEN